MIFGWSVTENKNYTFTHQLKTDTKLFSAIWFSEFDFCQNEERKKKLRSPEKLDRHTMGRFRCHFCVYSKQYNNLNVTYSHTKIWVFAFIGLGKIKDHAKVYK